MRISEVVYWRTINRLKPMICVGSAVLAMILSGIASADRTTPADKVEGVKVAELHWGEPYAAMVFHADHLWVGKSRSDKGIDYRVAIFDRDDQLVQEIPLRHSPSYMSVYNESSILVTGTSSEPNLTAWSIITKSGTATGPDASTKFTVKHHWIPADAWSNGWLGTISGREYFADMGGNQNDDDISDNPTLAAQTVFSIGANGRPSYSKVRMRGPLSGWRWQNQLVILRADSVIGPMRNLVILDPLTKTVRDAVGRSLDGGGEPALMADGKRMIVAEQFAGRVLFVGLDDGSIEEFETAGSPKSVAALGHCGVAGFEQEKKGLIVSSEPGMPVEVAGTFDFSAIDDRFQGLRRIAVDSQTGRIYGASVYPCNPFLEDCSLRTNLIVATRRGVMTAVNAKCLN